MKTIYFAHDLQEDPEPRRHALEVSGFVVRCFGSSAELLEAASKLRPDLVLCDILLEGQNGFEVCRELRMHHTPTELPVILGCTIYRSRIYRDEAQKCGAQGYLLRPGRPEELLQLVSEVLGLVSSAPAAEDD